MSGSEQHDRVALVSVADQAIIGEIVNRNLLEIDFGERQTSLGEAQVVLRRVVQYTEPAAVVQRVCDHQAQIIRLQKQITNLQSEECLPPECDHSMFKQQFEALRPELEQFRSTPRMVRSDKDLQQELDEMTWNARQSGEEVRALRMQLANALSLASRAAPAPPHQLQDWGQKFPNSPDISGFDRTQWRGWIAQLQMVVRHKPTSLPNEPRALSVARWVAGHCRGFALKPLCPARRIGNGTVWGYEGLLYV